MWDLVLKYLRITRSWSFLYEFREWHNTGTIWKAITDMLRYLPIDCYSTSANGNPAIHQSVSQSISQRGNHAIPKRSTKGHGSIANDNSKRNKKKHPPPTSWDGRRSTTNIEEQKKTNSSCSNRHHPPSGDSHQYKEKKRKLDGSDGTRYWSGFCLFESTLMDKQKSGQTKVSLKKKGRRKV